MRGVKTKTGNKWKNVAAFIFLLIISGLLFNSLYKVYQKKRGADELLVRMDQELSMLGERKRSLEVSLDRLSTEEGIKFEIKKKLNVAAPGENVAIIVESETASSTTSTPTSLWQKIKNFFSGWFE